ncbi:MAG: FAD-dependent oxidoreductase [Rhodobacteraceae bacterium]|nr:FAD-dependent oxidoreductase [Paracoccaceae bacterium]
MIIIIGGGVIGLSLAFRLLSAGQAVTVVERAAIGQGASWAAAGYLEPTLTKSETARVEWKSLQDWPQFVQEIEECCGLDVDFQTRGQLRIAHAETEQAVRHDHDARIAAGWQVEGLSATQLRGLEPALSDEITWASYLPQVSWVDGRKLCHALAVSLGKLGGKLVENTRVLSLNMDLGQVTGVQTDKGDISADVVVVAAGFQTDLIGNLPADLPKSYGQKGIILTLQGPSDAPILRHLIKRADGVLCPRNDGRIIVGVTKDDGNFADQAEAGSVARLLQSGFHTLPKLADMYLTETVVGFRPFVFETKGSAIGESSQTRGLFHSLGHGSDGYLRAPYYTEQLANMILSPTGSG